MFRLDLEGRKWDIFESAIYIFAERGYENVSMRELAKINDIRAASIYYYFDSKDTLLNTMYEFYAANIKLSSPDIDKIMKKIPYQSAKEILFQCLNQFSDELQPLMDCIYLIVVSQQAHDPRAYKLIQESTFAYPENFITRIVTRMVDIGKIEPLDIECFVKLYASFMFTAAFFNYSAAPIAFEKWKACLELLSALLVEKKDQAATALSLETVKSNSA